MKTYPGQPVSRQFPFNYNGQTFVCVEGDKGIKRVVRQIWARHEIDEEFESPLLAALLAERHQSYHGQTATKFRRVAHENFHDGERQAFLLSQGWVPASINNCMSGWPDKHKAFQLACRAAVAPQLAAYRHKHLICEVCSGIRDMPAQEVHHVNPTWKDIFTWVMHDYGERYIDTLWTVNHCREIPPKDRLYQELVALHEEIELCSVCLSCHQWLTQAPHLTPAAARKILLLTQADGTPVPNPLPPPSSAPLKPKELPGRMASDDEFKRFNQITKKETP